MRPPPSPRRFLPLAAAVGGACILLAAPLRAQAPAPAPAGSAVPLSPTSSVGNWGSGSPAGALRPKPQCVEGPGAPPADPTKVTRVAPGQPPAPAAPPEEPSLDAPPAPGAPARVLLEGALFAGVSARFDDASFFETTRRVGPIAGGSLFVSPSRLLSFGAAYAHTDLNRNESPRTSTDVIALDYETHTLLAEARVTPLRFSSLALFASIGAGLAWQSVSLRAALAPIGTSPGASFTCRAGSNAELAFRGALGIKARFTRAASLLLDASFVGYRLTADILGDCAPGAGTAQTLMVRAGLAYDIDISKLVR